MNTTWQGFLSVYMFHIWQILKSFHFFNATNFLSDWNWQMEKVKQLCIVKINRFYCNIFTWEKKILKGYKKIQFYFESHVRCHLVSSWTDKIVVRAHQGRSGEEGFPSSSWWGMAPIEKERKRVTSHYDPVVVTRSYWWLETTGSLRTSGSYMRPPLHPGLQHLVIT